MRDEKDKTFLGAISLVAQHFFFLSFSNIFPFDLSNFSTSDLLTIFDGSQSVVVPKSHFIYRRGREREREREREKKNQNVRLKRNFEVGTMRSILGQEPEMLA